MSNRRTPNEARFMYRALDLAWRGRGFVEPNPMVGCVIVKRNRIIGEGWHRRFGGPHAEVWALRQAGRDARGATAYVTLEPCSHFGKTPPCVDALIAAAVTRVVAAMKDPNPLVSGKGFAKLRAAGIRVSSGVLENEAASMNAPFIKYQRHRLPYVILKWAQSIDGKIATAAGDSKWITSVESRRAAHSLRACVDAIIVGVGTVLADDPSLTARLVRPRRIATRIVLDSRLRTPPSSRLVRTARRTPTLIVTSRAGRGQRRKWSALERAGCEVLEMGSDRQGIRLRDLLAELHAREMTNVMVEGGSQVLGSFVDQGLADEARLFVAPILIGGAAAPGPLGGRGPRKLGKAPRVRISALATCGPDLCYNLAYC